MATTIPGGAYLSADKKTWHDANGEEIPSPIVENVMPIQPDQFPNDPEPKTAIPVVDDDKKSKKNTGK